MRIVVTERGSPLAVGTELTVDEIPQWLENKCKVVTDEAVVLEVATPSPEPEQPKPKRQGRKPKTQPAE